MEIFEYSYMNRALIIGFFLAIVIPLMGIVVVNKNMSTVGDALSHVSLSGVLLGLITGVTPVFMAVVCCVLAALFLEFIRKRFPSHQEIATAIVMSTGVGVASILSGFVKQAANFESYLFGSIIAITDSEFYLTIGISILVFLVFVHYYRDLEHISFDQMSAKLSGIDVERVNTIFMVLVAITISIASRTVGVLIISSIMVIPVACAIRLEKSYFLTTVYSVVLGIFFMMSGIISSFYLGTKPGGTIVLISIITLLIILFIKRK